MLPREVEVPEHLLTTDAMGLVTRDDIDLVVEVIGGIEPARSLILAALEGGASVVTANKALLAEDGATLFASRRGRLSRDLYYEAAVAGAIPILRPLRESLAGDKVTRVLGIVNGTTNFILDKMDTSGPASPRRWKRPSSWVMPRLIRPPTSKASTPPPRQRSWPAWPSTPGSPPADVHREGITDVSAADVASAREMGAVVKLLAICAARHARMAPVSARVHPAMIPRTHPWPACVRPTTPSSWSPRLPDS
jgi:homoserine dehydrogenase